MRPKRVSSKVQFLGEEVCRLLRQSGVDPETVESVGFSEDTVLIETNNGNEYELSGEMVSLSTKKRLFGPGVGLSEVQRLHQLFQSYETKTKKIKKPV